MPLSDMLWVAVGLGVTALLIGVIIIVARWLQSGTGGAAGDAGSTDRGGSVVRSWIAVILVLGLLVFCAIALSLGDQQLRGTLFGGVVASTGAAIAHYFSASSADEARKDILNASMGTETVPKIEGLTLDQAQVEMAGRSLALQIHPPNATGSIDHQNPPSGTTVSRGTLVDVTLRSP